MIATSGLVSRIQSCDFSKPEKIRFQYGSSVFPLSSATPMAGTCDEPIPATILAKGCLFVLHFRFADLVFDLGLALRLAEADLLAPPARRCSEGAFLPERERLPSIERPPPSIIAA